MLDTAIQEVTCVKGVGSRTARDWSTFWKLFSVSDTDYQTPKNPRPQMNFACTVEASREDMLEPFKKPCKLTVFLESQPQRLPMKSSPKLSVSKRIPNKKVKAFHVFDCARKKSTLIIRTK